MKNKTEEYFNAFNSQDLDKLREIYAEGMCLRDWTHDGEGVCGKENVISANQELFNSVESLNIDVLFMHADGDVVACEILVHLGEETIKVVDVITFDEEGKIKSLRAYVG